MVQPFNFKNVSQPILWGTVESRESKWLGPKILVPGKWHSSDSFRQLGRIIDVRDIKVSAKQLSIFTISCSRPLLTEQQEIGLWQ